MGLKKIPLRKCIGCNEMKPKKELLRILKTPENDIVLDVTGRQNGRGAYLCNNVECFRRAATSRGLERSLQTAIPAKISEELEKELIAGGAGE